MSVKEVGLSWITVKDVKAAVKYYTEVVGLKLLNFYEAYGWAELCGEEGGTILAIGEENPSENIHAGQNAVVTFTVSDVAQAKEEMVKKGAQCIGDIIEIPGHVKMQTVLDQDGNCFQICEPVEHHF